ncbi:MAG: hypothetical protein KF819_21545 [Labilithrix sp.]|nr:hypothetical protein [Labilithrix sp.]
MTTIKGDMFTMIIGAPRAEIRIVKNPSIDSATGAQGAIDLAAEGAKLPARGVREILFDIRDAPAVAGPKSTEAVAGMLRSWEAARTRVAVVVSDDAIKKLQFNRLVTEHAPKHARIFASLDEAELWLGGG